MFTPEYKLAMVAAYDRTVSGEHGALLRRERLYHSHLIEWRKACDAGTLVAGRAAEQTETGPAEQTSAAARCGHGRADGTGAAAPSEREVGYGPGP